MNIKKYFSIILLFVVFFINVSPTFAIEEKQAKKARKSKTVDIKNDQKTQYLNLDWWNKFNDPILADYILETATSNYDIKMNELKVLQAKEIMKEGRSNQLPSVNFAPYANRERVSGSIPFMGEYCDPYYTAGIQLPLNVNYEVDIWGKNHFNTKKLKKDYEAMRYDEKAAFITFTTLTAATYFNVLNIDKQIEIQKELVNLRKEIYELTKVNFDYGVVSSTDVTQMNKSYIEAQSGLEIMKKNQAKLLNELAVLIGTTSENSADLKRNSIDNIKPLENLPSSIETEIINQRPDILKAEAELQGAMFDVKAARRSLLPSINLVGMLGFNAYNFEKMFDYRSFIFNARAGLVQPIFQGGRLIANLKNKKYRYDEMFNNYQKTILTSIQEINDSLVELKSDTKRNKNDIKRLQDETKTFEDVNFKYEKGAVSYLDTLRFKETLLVAKQEEIQSKTECLIDSLGLYKAVGGKL